MTQLMHAGHLRQIAGVAEQPDMPAQRVVPVMCWTMDAETGRPTSHWVRAEKHRPIATAMMPAASDISFTP